MKWRCPLCKVQDELTKDAHKLLRTIVSTGKEWIILTCPHCRATVGIDKSHSMYETLTLMSPVAHISTPKIEGQK